MIHIRCVRRLIFYLICYLNNFAFCFSRCRCFVRLLSFLLTLVLSCLITLITLIIRARSSRYLLKMALSDLVVLSFFSQPGGQSLLLRRAICILGLRLIDLWSPIQIILKVLLLLFEILLILLLGLHQLLHVLLVLSVSIRICSCVNLLRTCILDVLLLAHWLALHYLLHLLLALFIVQSIVHLGVHILVGEHVLLLWRGSLLLDLAHLVVDELVLLKITKRHVVAWRVEMSWNRCTLGRGQLGILLLRG